jgi:hypothetical protein
VPADSHELEMIDHHDSEEDLVGRWFQKEWLPMQTEENTEILVKTKSKNCKTYQRMDVKLHLLKHKQAFKRFPASKLTKSRRQVLLSFLHCQCSQAVLLQRITHIQATLSCPDCFICRMP